MTTTVAKPAGSSGSSEGFIGNIDEKKRRRMESNRESARRSRQRKQQHLDDLIKQASSLKRENEEFGKKIEEFTTVFTAMESQNSVLKSEKDRLAARLESLENIVEIAKVVRGSNSYSNLNNYSSGNEGLFYDLVNDDPMMKPWQLLRHSLPVMASSGVSGLRY